MDFKRPTDQSGHDIDAQFEQSYTPKAEPSPAAQPASAPAAPVVAKKSSKGYKFLTSLLLILLLAATGYAVYAYLNEQALRNDLTAAETRVGDVTTLNTSLTNKLSDAKAQDAVAADLSTKEKVDLAASNHACVIADFGCDKNVYTIKKTQEFSADAPGFAVVEVKSSTNKSTTLYLKSSDGELWVVVYEGTAAPSAEVIKRYAIPAGFAS